MTRHVLRVDFLDAEKQRLFATGRNAETLLLLMAKGQRGANAFDFPGGPPFRLAAYVHNLRKLGLLIETLREPHKGGNHARYVLRSHVEITGKAYNANSGIEYAER